VDDDKVDVAELLIVRAEMLLARQEKGRCLQIGGVEESVLRDLTLAERLLARLKL